MPGSSSLYLIRQPSMLFCFPWLKIRFDNQVVSSLHSNYFSTLIFVHPFLLLPLDNSVDNNEASCHYQEAIICGPRLPRVHKYSII